jgi:hypothetical protein
MVATAMAAKALTMASRKERPKCTVCKRRLAVKDMEVCHRCGIADWMEIRSRPLQEQPTRAIVPYRHEWLFPTPKDAFEFYFAAREAQGFAPSLMGKFLAMLQEQIAMGAGGGGRNPAQEFILLACGRIANCLRGKNGRQPSKQTREILCRFYLFHQSESQIADEMRLTRNGVHTMLHQWYSRFAFRARKAKVVAPLERK